MTDSTAQDRIKELTNQRNELLAYIIETYTPPEFGSDDPLHERYTVNIRCHTCGEPITLDRFHRWIHANGAPPCALVTPYMPPHHERL